MLTPQLIFKAFRSSSIFVSLSFALAVSAQVPLTTGFLNAPDSAKPLTWWHWMNGNVTKEGITADLEAMKQIGLGGATVVNVDCDIPRGNVPFMSPAWREELKFAVQEAHRLGLKLGVENCAGWSSSGGPWNTVTNAMQRLTSSEITVAGPTNFNDGLPLPPVTLGFYRDIAVLGFKDLSVEDDPAAHGLQTPPKLEIKHAVFEGKNGGGSGDVTAKVIRLIRSGHKAILASTDELGGDPASGSVKRLRVDFTLDGNPATLTVNEGDALIFPVNTTQLAAIRSFEKFLTDRTFVRPPAATVFCSGEAIPHDGVVDLTQKMGADGRLRWNVPPGNWIILRLGYTPIGVNNHPAPKEGEGLECDKFSKAALDAHWEGFLKKVLDDAGPLAGGTLDASLIDSYEIGNQDWTANFRDEFQKRRGYDPLPFSPTFTRCIVDNPAVTERFFWDMRRTIADLFAENYYGHFSELCQRHGLLSEIEPYTGPFESLPCGAPADVVMGEFWAGSQGDPSVKLAASVAHIYGKTIVGAEAFTGWPNDGQWQDDPYSLKPLGDLMFCEGVNRYYFHRYAMQPWTNRWPGMTMGPFGINFERTLTWWNQGKAWIRYISRCQFLLQQGRAVADAAYFDGQSAPVVTRANNPALPAGYDYDAVDADVLLHGATIKNDRLTLASGANYALLILPSDDINLTPPVLHCLRELVRAGATVVGPRPQHSPSLEGYPECDAQVKTMAEELWGPCDGKTVLEHDFGKGHVIWGKSPTDIFAAQNLKPDFEFQGASASTRLVYAHRTDPPADIYFISNQRRQSDSAECTFRVSGMIPELWQPDSGEMEIAPVWSAHDGRTTVRLDFDPAGSVFVIFRRAAGEADHVVACETMTGGPKLEIQHAIYRGTDGSGEKDVTAKLSSLVRGGKLALEVNNDALGGDPAIMRTKEVVVDYVLDGNPARTTVRENETLTLSAESIGGPASPWAASVAPDGSPLVRAWGNCDVQLKTADGRVLHAKATNLPKEQELNGTWTLSFPPNLGAPPAISLDKLISWPEHTNAGVRYFSGTAAYENEIEVSAGRLSAGRELWLDLGRVKNFAEVSLNGQDLGAIWKPPFRVNVTAAAKTGSNKLVVKVTNLWPNRIIGDEQMPADCEWNGDKLRAWPQWLLEGKASPTGRITFETCHHYSKNSPLLESGMFGPVTLRTAEIIPAH
ncbi:MAG: glycosyl hydrolase [Verrucomicrobiota bacterium]